MKLKHVLFSIIALALTCSFIGDISLGASKENTPLVVKGDSNGSAGQKKDQVKPRTTVKIKNDINRGTIRYVFEDDGLRVTGSIDENNIEHLVTIHESTPLRVNYTISYELNGRVYRLRVNQLNSSSQTFLLSQFF